MNWPSLETLQVALQLAAARQVAFKVSLFMEIVWGLLYAATMLVFWKVIFHNFPAVGNYTFPEIALFMGFTEVFWGISRGFFGVTRFFWLLVNNGTLENHLCRPLDARLGLLLRHIELSVLYRSVSLSVVWFLLAFAQPSLRDPVALFLGFVQLLLGSLVFLFFSFALNFLSFRWGNTTAISELVGGFYDFLKYPMDILSLGLQHLFTFVVPATLVATLPTLIVTGRQDAWPALLLTVLLAALWYGLQELAWRTGLRRYTGHGG